MKTNKDLARRLAELPLFARCRRREIDVIARRFTPARIPAGRTLMREGTAGHQFVVIVEGTASVQRAGAHIATLGPGDHAGELALLERCPRTASVVAETDLVVQVASRSEFREVLSLSPNRSIRCSPGWPIAPA